MIRNLWVKRIFAIILLLFLQLTFLRHFNLYGQAFCYCYVGAFLLMPIRFPSLYAMLIAFLLGLVVDMAYNTPGMHTAALTLVGFLRPALLRILMPSGGYEDADEPGVAALGLTWFALYSLPLLFIHHLVLHIIEFSNLTFFLRGLMQAFFSSFVTFFVFLIIVITFETRKRRR